MLFKLFMRNSEKIIWWRWGELNPRPKTFSQEVYMLSTGLLL